MIYYLIFILAVLFSFFLAIYKEKKFQRKLDKLEELRSEIKEISKNIENLKTDDLITTEHKNLNFASYKILDSEYIKNDQYETELNKIICNTVKYGNKNKNIVMKKPHMKRHDSCWPFDNHSYAQ